MTGQDLASTARALVAEGKGILAADESTGTIEKRFESIGAPSTEANRRGWRELLFTTTSVAEHISGVILFDETLRQASSTGTPFAELLTAHGLLPGIKVDKGAKDLAGAPGEKITEGLDGLRERLSEYRDLGARFTKWRAVIAIAEGRPSAYCREANAHALARFAALSQEAGLVPIVEPEVLMDGAHNIARARAVTEAVLHDVFAALFAQHVALEGMLLKPNMITPGTECAEAASVEQVAAATIASFRTVVPAAVPGIVFLSGGQSEELATAHLNAMNALAAEVPWQLSFSYGRALQTSALKAWRGHAANVMQAQQAFRRRAQLNGAARHGAYRPEQEQEAVPV